MLSWIECITYVTKLIHITYKIGCFVGTFGMVYILLEQYFLNDDSSKILIKRFDENNRKSFPTITLCFHVDGSGGLYENQFLSSNTGLTVERYRDILLGRKIISNKSHLNDPDFFQNSTIKLKNYVTKFKVKDINDDDIIKWKASIMSTHPNASTDIPFSLYYNDPTFLCYSFHAGGIKDITIDSVNYYFSISKLQGIDKGELYMFIHYDNQLIRNMRYVYKLRSFNGIRYQNSNNQLILDMRYISIMRSRQDAKEPCDEKLENDDKNGWKMLLRYVDVFLHTGRIYFRYLVFLRIVILQNHY